MLEQQPTALVPETAAMVEVTEEVMAEEKEAEKVVAMVPMCSLESPEQVKLT